QLAALAPGASRHPRQGNAAMTTAVENSNLLGFEPLLTPTAAKAKHPLSQSAAELVLKTRTDIRNLLSGADPDRLLIIVGPCSIHDQQAAYAYAQQLLPLREELADVACVVMRTYF